MDIGANRSRVREVIVPTTYCTKSGAKFKARALQYCLEDDVNILRDEDWIVHLDEETLLSTNAVCSYKDIYQTSEFLSDAKII